MAESLLERSEGLCDKPIFHVAPAQGWVNDPNGPFMYRGKYHLFYQHLPQGCEWAFGLVWGHSVSADLVHWEHLPHAMVPTAKSLDADGCFSGCAAIDTDGTPVLLYTGVRLRTNPDAQPPPPPDCDLHLPFIESQLLATPADPGDPLLCDWVKGSTPFMALPPPNMNLTGWRDPFVVERPCEANNHEWVVLMGSGIKEVGGATIVYRTANLRDPAAWRYDGLLCVGEGDTGAVWECPLIAQLTPLPPGGLKLSSSSSRSKNRQTALGSRGSSALPVAAVGPSINQEAAEAADGPCHKHWHLQQQQQQLPALDGNSSSSAVSGQQEGCKPGGCQGIENAPLGLVNPGGLPPGMTGSVAGLSSWDERYTHFYSISPDACTNPTIYWLGRYAAGRFDLDSAKGPLRLDLGDVLYAPNVMRDDAERVLLWGWLQERRTVGTYDYAGCMTVPRLLYLDGDRLHQCPVPELAALRRGQTWTASKVVLGGHTHSLPLPGVLGSSCLDIEVVFARSTASTVGILLRSWHQAGEGGAAVLFNWDSGLLEVVFEALDPASMTFSLTAPQARRIGGAISHRQDQPLALRMLLDGSCLEVFTGSGEVLSTRIYRGSPPDHDTAGAGIEFVALDGEAVLERVAAHQMASIWAPHDGQRQQQAALLDGLKHLEQLSIGVEQQQQWDSELILGRTSSSLSSSLKNQQHLGMAAALATSEVAGRLEQLSLAPQAAVHEPQHHELPLEEEMTADIFDLEAL